MNDNLICQGTRCMFCVVIPISQEQDRSTLYLEGYVVSHEKNHITVYMNKRDSYEISRIATTVLSAYNMNINNYWVKDGKNVFDGIYINEEADGDYEEEEEEEDDYEEEEEDDYEEEAGPCSAEDFMIEDLLAEDENINIIKQRLIDTNVKRLLDYHLGIYELEEGEILEHWDMEDLERTARRLSRERSS